MTQSFTQVPPDSTGDKLDMRSRIKGADTLLEQGVYLPGAPTFRVFADSIVPASNKYHIALFNQAASAQTLFVTGLYCINLNVATVAGVINRFDFRRFTGAPTLTALTPMAFNSADPALSGVMAGHTVTAGITDGVVFQSLLMSSEEQTAVPTNTQMMLERLNLLQLSHPNQRPFALRPGEGCAIKQNGTGTVGALSWIIDFAVEPD